ncbi:MAG: phosphoglycolate phosphatase [Francisellaceae bacterium]
MYKHLFFDLDGTLVDSLPDITEALNLMRAEFNLTPISLDIVAGIIGKGFPTTTRRVLALDLDEHEVEKQAHKALQYTLMYYEQSMGKYTTIFPGVIETLQKLKSRHIPMAIVTNKEEEHAIKVLDQTSLSAYFDVIIGGDTTDAYKPDPEPLEYAMSQLNAMAATSLMIGDSANDSECANAAGIDIILIDHGYNNGVDLSSLKQNGIINHIGEILDYI